MIKCKELIFIAGDTQKLVNYWEKLVDPLFKTCFFVIFCIFKFYDGIDGKSCFSIKKIMLTSERCAEHPISGLNTQHLWFSEQWLGLIDLIRLKL